MVMSRRTGIQLCIAVALAVVMLALTPGSPAARLRVAADSTYRLLVPGLAGDGVP